MTTMTKAEREDLIKLINRREKARKSAVKQRSDELKADFENQMGQEFSFDQDEVWEQLAKDAEAFQRKIDQKMAVRCAELGVPKRFAPSFSVHWSGRGYDNGGVERRKAELRRMAYTQIEAKAQKVNVQIEMDSVEAQTKIATSGLTSEAARTFIENLQPIEKLMPALSFFEVAGEAEPPIAEQLVSSNALRQRRYRERQQALKNGNGDASRNVTAALCNAKDEIPDDRE